MRLQLPWLAGAMMWGAGLLMGTASDPQPERPVVMRAGYRVLQGDFHAHTRFSDGLLSPLELPIQASRRGLDVLGVTEHNMVLPAKMSRWLSEQIDGPLIVVGEEITTADYHVIGLGLTERVDASLPLQDVIDDVHRQGGVVVAAHPVERFWPALIPARDQLDATELMHPIAYRQGRDGWNWEHMQRYYLESGDPEPRLAALGVSDYHFFSPLGVCRTLVFVQEPTSRGVIDAIRARRTVVTDLSGRMYGAPELVEALRRDPVVLSEQDYGYVGTGVVDRMGRWLSWLGLLMMVLLRRRSTSA